MASKNIQEEDKKYQHRSSVDSRLNVGILKNGKDARMMDSGARYGDKKKVEVV